MLTEGFWERISTTTLTWGSSAAGITKTSDIVFAAIDQRKNRNRRIRIDCRNASTVTALTCKAKSRITSLATTATYVCYATLGFATAGNLPESRVLSGGLAVGDWSSTGTIARLYFSNDTAVNTSQGFKAKLSLWAERSA